MLHQQHGHASGGEGGEHAGELVGLGRVEPGGRLVEEQDARVGSKGAGDLDEARPARREGVDPGAGVVGQPDPLELPAD